MAGDTSSFSIKNEDDDGKETDDMLLYPGLKRPPYKGSVAKEIMESWKPESKRRNARQKERGSQAVVLSRGGVCMLIVFIIIGLVITIALGYIAGFLVGKKIGKDSRGGAGCSSSSSSSKDTPTLRKPSMNKFESITLDQVNPVILSDKKYDWGDEVTVNGSSTKVTEVFSSMLHENDIRDYLLKLTELPHIAGSDTNRDLAMDIYKEWSGYGFDSVEVINYTVLLSYPNKDKPNSLRLKDSSGAILYDSKIAEEPPLTDDEKKPNVAAPFNAYSGSGTVTGPLVYVNYGRIDDFLYLTNGTFLKLDLSKYICIARYGGIYRGDKAHLAESYGCKGLLIYSDPEDYAPNGTLVYPNGPSLPEYGVQRGTLFLANGDPQTPGIPSITGMYRRPYSDVEAEKSVPTIPVQPVSYGDIIHFMSQLSDHTPPDSWVGGLNITYSIAQSDDDSDVTELVVNVNQTQKTIHNVVAKLYGGVEPDLEVLLGNHRDAWVFGAADPNSGTAVLLDIAKTIGSLRADHNWRPGRTLVLCSWDSEEYGLIGSTEYVEDFGKTLESSAVAYLNVDIAVSGSLYTYTSANPVLYEPVWQAAMKVPSPNSDGSTLYDDWLKVSSKPYGNKELKPKIENLGSGSDFTSFLQLYGISCTNMAYKNTTHITHYAVYHSVHDNFDWMSNFGDPGFTHHKALGLLWIYTALSLLTSPVLPGKARDYGFIVQEIYENLSDEFEELLDKNGVTLDYLSKAVTNFVAACQDYDDKRKNLTSSVANISQELHLIRIVNNQLMDVERAFIHPEGLPGRPYYKHVLFAPSSANSYESSLFPGISDSIFNALHSGGDTSSWNEVKKQIDIVRTHLRYATQILLQPSLHYAPMK